MESKGEIVVNQGNPTKYKILLVHFKNEENFRITAWNNVLSCERSNQRNDLTSTQFNQKWNNKGKPYYGNKLKVLKKVETIENEKSKSLMKL